MMQQQELCPHGHPRGYVFCEACHSKDLPTCPHGNKGFCGFCRISILTANELSATARNSGRNGA